MKLWVRLQVYEREYGIVAPETCRIRKRWAKVHRLRMKLDSVNIFRVIKKKYNMHQIKKRHPEYFE